MLRARISQPKLFEDPWEYLCGIENLPFPPNISFQNESWLENTSDMFSPVEVHTAADTIPLRDPEFWSLYSASTQILQDILYEGKPKCAFRDWDVQCPASGNVLGVPDHRRPKAGCICDSAFRLVAHEGLEIVPM